MQLIDTSSVVVLARDPRVALVGRLAAGIGGLVVTLAIDEGEELILVEQELIAMSKKGQVIRTETKSISVLGRATQGVRIMRLEEGDKVASGTCIKE